MPGSAGLPEILAGVLMVALNAYALFGGGDFGGGIWHLLASGERQSDQRALISRSIAPIWEANHVWLIVAVVVLFTAFPRAFSLLSIALHIPLTMALFGIVLRGSAFVFRSYGSRTRAQERFWERTFEVASLVTPFFLGVSVGGIASGNVGSAVLAASSADSMGTFSDVYVWPWLAPFPIATGFMAVTLFAFLAAVYLTVAARDDEMRGEYRRRALVAALAVFVAALAALLLAAGDESRLGRGLTTSTWSLGFHVLTGMAALTAVFALIRRRWRLARVAAGAQVSLVLWGWAAAQYPYLIPRALTIRDAAAPANTLQLLLLVLLAGGAVLLPSLLYLYRTFAAARR
jgi:cytochrome d ubiquinol oxidase subunit II